MPYKKKITKRKPYKRRNRKKNSYAMVKQPNVISDSTIVTLRYCDFKGLDAGIGGKAYDTWSATSIYDPYVGAGGHQPLGSDEWSVFYNHFVVLGAKATCHYNVYSTAVSDSVIAVGKVTDSYTWAATDVNTLIEQNKSSYKFLTSNGGSRNSGSITLYYSPKSFFGVKNVQDEHDLRGVIGTSGTDPNENAYFHFGVSGMNPGDNPTTVNTRVIIEYRVLLTERKTLASS